MSNLTAQQIFDAEQQVRYEGIQAKYLPMHQEATKLWKESIKIMKPYVTRKLQCTGAEYWATVRKAESLKKQSTEMRLTADSKIQHEFWNPV